MIELNFCDFRADVRKQQQSAQLTKERDHLFETIKAYRSLFDTTRQLINEMKGMIYQLSFSSTVESVKK